MPPRLGQPNLMFGATEVGSALTASIEDRPRVRVVVQRLLGGELEPAPRRASNRLIAGFDYPQSGF